MCRSSSAELGLGNAFEMHRQRSWELWLAEQRRGKQPRHSQCLCLPIDFAFSHWRKLAIGMRPTDCVLSRRCGRIPAQTLLAVSCERGRQPRRCQVFSASVGASLDGAYG